MERERCLLCGRFKTYNAGLICTNINCKDGITFEQDWLEIYKLRNTKNDIKI